jgi:hypothetical protein
MDGLLAILDGAVDMLGVLLSEGRTKAMNLFNNRDFLDVPRS